MLDQGAFHLERADTVAGGRDDIVGAADEPKITIAVSGGCVTGKYHPFRKTRALPETGSRKYP